ncbi:MAG: amidohydrolase family protein [Peptococcaceae bacterium]|nr:amidohydrolase family protein [Peptococcaceae bacterium]
MNGLSIFSRRQFAAKVLSVLLAVALLLPVSALNAQAATDSGCTQTPEATAGSGCTQGAMSYTDVNEDDWFYTPVDYVSARGILTGVAENRFAPNEAVTRAMVVTVMWRMSGAPQNDGQSSFTDADSARWYAQALAWGEKQKLVSGYSRTVFAPNEPVTREQLAAFMQRYDEWLGKDVSVKDDDALEKFSDGDKVSAWAEDAMAWALDKKILAGMTATTLAPQGEATRAQYSAMLSRSGANVADTVIPKNYESLTYYHNGNIITVDEEVGENDKGEPIYAKAVLAGDGYIVAVAYTDEELADLEKRLKDVKYEDVDLDGETMIPAFLDAHSHLNMVDQYADASPSAGVTSLEKLVEIGKADFAAWEKDTTYDAAYGDNEPGGKFWFVTNGFDNTAYQDGWKEQGLEPYAMPTKEILDMISTEYPIIYIHASSHLGVVNSLGMKLLEEKVASMGLESFANPSANWDVDADGNYTGVIRENGFYVLARFGALWNPTTNRTASSSDIIANAMKVYASNGITTGITGNGGDKLVAQIPEDERIIDLTCLTNYDTRLESAKQGTTAASRYDENHVKNGSVKLFLDGSPQGKTAWFSVDATDPSGGGYYRNATETLLTNKTADTAWWWGEKEGKKMDTAVLTEEFTNMMQEGISFHCHANGTGAIDQYIDAYRQALENNGVDPSDEKAVAEMKDRVRAVIIHGQTITQKQLEECDALGINISFFTDHVYYYGDYHLYSTLGPDRGQRISPMADALASDKDINITMHQDSPIAPPNMLFSIYNAATRITRDGQAIGRGSADGSSDNDKRITDRTNQSYDTRDERVSAYEALKCVTINSAWQNFEEDSKGSIAVGKQADFVILNTNILTNDFLGLNAEDAQSGAFIEKTINNDKVIYEK